MAKSKVQFTLDQDGVAEILTSGTVIEMTNAAANQLAGNLRGLLPDDVTVDVVGYTSDRGAASVAIAHPSGKARQLRHGSLTKAAGMMGLTVRSK